MSIQSREQREYWDAVMGREPREAARECRGLPAAAS